MNNKFKILLATLISIIFSFSAYAGGKYSGPDLTIDMSLDTKRWKKYNILQNEI